MKILFSIGIILAVCSSCFSQAANINYMILESRVDRLNNHVSARVIFFLGIVDSVNFAGENFRTVLLEAEFQEHIKRNTRTENDTLNFLTGALLDSINIGAIHTKIENINFAAGTTNVQKRDVIDLRFTALQSEFMDSFYSKYHFWGLERIVP